MPIYKGDTRMSPPIPYECVDAVNWAGLNGILGGVVWTLAGLFLVFSIRWLRKGRKIKDAES